MIGLSQLGTKAVRHLVLDRLSGQKKGELRERLLLGTCSLRGNRMLDSLGKGRVQPHADASSGGVS